MVKYPKLSTKQQAELPALIKPASRLPMMFDDSTHQLWHCQTVDGPMMLKVCNQNTVKTSSFWQGMNHLFALDFPGCLADMATIYSHIQQLSSLTVPTHIASSFSDSSAYILAGFIGEENIEAGAITERMVQDLARYISNLHHHHSATWGTLLKPQLSGEQWSTRLQDTLKILAATQSIPKNMLDDALQQAAAISHADGVPIMIDLRWDQFLQQHGGLSAVVDLDAYVTAPRALELVILEYLLDESQAAIFKQHYQQTHSIPDLTDIRTPYRLLLFLMNILGEKSVETWMNMPTRF